MIRLREVGGLNVRYWKIRGAYISILGLKSGRLYRIRSSLSGILFKGWLKTTV